MVAGPLVATKMAWGPADSVLSLSDLWCFNGVVQYRRPDGEKARSLDHNKNSLSSFRKVQSELANENLFQPILLSTVYTSIYTMKTVLLLLNVMHSSVIGL